MPRQDHWNKVGEGEGEVDRVRELCDMVSVNIIINILVNINLHDIQNNCNLWVHSIVVVLVCAEIATQIIDSKACETTKQY